MDLLDNPDRLADNDTVAAAARIAYMFKQDPLVMIAGWHGARQVERDQPMLAMSVRVAAAQVITADMDRAETEAKRKAR